MAGHLRALMEHLVGDDPVEELVDQQEVPQEVGEHKFRSSLSRMLIMEMEVINLGKMLIYHVFLINLMENGVTISAKLGLFKSVHL